ncbi:MAG: hemolysin C [Spirochaetes bacterium]|nr:MAG: hemolysin C [Spirochaetota bacterium]
MDKISIQEQKEMIEGVEHLGETVVKEVMVPRTDTIFLSQEATAEEAYSTLVKSGHSRIPVYRESIDDVIGILYAKDVLAALVQERGFDMASLMRKPFFVPETKRIDSLLKEFKRRRVHIAVVVDEYGGTSGIVCMEDIIEEIVGEIQDEFDNEAEDLVNIGPDTWICDARLMLDEVQGATGIVLPVEEYDSLAGFVFDVFGKIPEEGESVQPETTKFTVVKMEGHRILKVKIEKCEVNEHEESEPVGQD